MAKELTTLTIIALICVLFTLGNGDSKEIVGLGIVTLFALCCMIYGIYSLEKDYKRKCREQEEKKKNKEATTWKSM